MLMPNQMTFNESHHTCSFKLGLKKDLGPSISHIWYPLVLMRSRLSSIWETVRPSAPR